MTEKTDKKQKPEHLFKPGQSGNILGRPKGSRNKLGEAFIEAMHADFTQHGPTVIEQVRTEKPDQYLKVVASILPKELRIKDSTLDDMSDNELADLLVTIRSIASSHSGKKSIRGTGKAESKEGTGPARRTH